jgi:hypothetical protein
MSTYTRESKFATLAKAAFSKSGYEYLADNDDLPFYTDSLRSRYALIITDNEGTWDATSHSSAAEVHDECMSAVFQCDKYAWWPMFVLDVERNSWAPVDVKTTITIEGMWP